MCHVKNSRPGHDLRTSLNDRVISPFRNFARISFLRIFACAKFRENISLAEFSEFAVIRLLYNVNITYNTEEQYELCQKEGYEHIKMAIRLSRYM